MVTNMFTPEELAYLLHSGQVVEVNETELNKVLSNYTGIDLIKLALYSAYAARQNNTSKDFFYYIFNFVVDNYPIEANANAHLIPEYGDWSDVFYFLEKYFRPTTIPQSQMKSTLLNLIINSLKQKDPDAIRYAPDFSNQNNALIAQEICNLWGIDPSEYIAIIKG
jgi:hypothetical protein